MVKGNGFLSLTGLMLAAGLLVLYLGLCLTGSQRSRSHQAVDGRPQHTMSVVITAPDGAYERSIVVAAQTGRIRLA